MLLDTVTKIKDNKEKNSDYSTTIESLFNQNSAFTLQVGFRENQNFRHIYYCNVVLTLRAYIW